MKTTLRTLVALTCVASVALVVAGDDRQSLDAQYARLCKSLKGKQTKVLYAMLAPGFTWVDVTGRVMSRADFIAMDGERMKTPGLTFHEVSMKNDSYDFNGGEARVRSTSTFVMSMLENGKRVKYRAVSEGVDTWRKGPRGWMVYKVEVTSDTFAPVK